MKYKEYYIQLQTVLALHINDESLCVKLHGCVGSETAYFSLYKKDPESGENNLFSGRQLMISHEGWPTGDGVEPDEDQEEGELFATFIFDKDFTNEKQRAFGITFIANETESTNEFAATAAKFLFEGVLPEAIIAQMPTSAALH